MKGEFITKTIEEVTDVLIDYRGKTPPKTTSGVKLITAKVIKDGFVQDGDHEYIAEDYYDPWMRRGFPQQWDILLTTEAPLGEVAQLRTPERVALAQRVILLRGKPHVIDQGYYFQALKSPFVQAELRARSTGTTVLGIKQSELRRIRIPYYPLPSQQKIASILATYDDLIANNTRRIALLQDVVRLVYAERLAKGSSSARGGGKVRRAGLVPGEWKTTTLGEIAKDERVPVNPKSVAAETPYVGLEHIPRRSIALGEWGRAGDVQSLKLRFKAGDILFGKIRPYFHKVAIAPVDGVCSSDAIVISAKKPEWFPLVLACVSSDDFVRHAVQTSNGTKMPRANWEVLLKYPIVLPPDDILQRFGHLIETVVERIVRLALATRNLHATRDLLLPRLIAGDIDVAQLRDERVALPA